MEAAACRYRPAARSTRSRSRPAPGRGIRILTAHRPAGETGAVKIPSVGLMRFLQLELDQALTLDPQAPDWTGRRLVRLIAGNPVTMGEMARHVADAGSYAPVTILIQELPDGGTRVAYDTVASEIAPYHDAAAAQVAERLDTEVLDLLRQVTGEPASVTP